MLRKRLMKKMLQCQRNGVWRSGFRLFGSHHNRMSITPMSTA